MRAVLDPSVLLAGLLAADGAPARLLRSWLTGGFELVASPRLLSETERALDFPRLAGRLAPERVAALIELIRRARAVADDPLHGPLPGHSPDRDDDYLIALALSNSAVLVTGDEDLLGLAELLPIRAPEGFLAVVEATA